MAREVKEKQDLVMALSKEKHNLTQELQKKIKEIRKKKHQIKKQIQAQAELFPSSEIAMQKWNPYNLPKDQPEPETHMIEKVPEKEIVSQWRFGGKASRNVVVSAMNSQEVQGKTASQHSTKVSSDKLSIRDSQQETQVAKVLEHYDQRVILLQKDQEIYGAQTKKMMQTIVVLTTQLEEAKQKALECLI